MKIKYGERVSLLYTDTDSLLMEVQTENIYQDMDQNLDLYDTSDFPKDHYLQCTQH